MSERTEEQRRLSRERSLRWYWRNRDERVQITRANGIRRRYGLDVDEYEAILAQGCAICGIHDKPGAAGMHMDHDHKTGVVRGALCGRCNRGLGHFDDDPEKLRAAVDYLEGVRNDVAA